VTPWLLPENRAALEAVLPIVKQSSMYVQNCHSESKMEPLLNMAALAWLESDSPVESVTLRFGSGRTVTEQIIEAVRVWADGGDKVDRVDGEEVKA